MSVSNRTGKTAAGSGLWNYARHPQYSKETQELMKLMMQESRLTSFQQRQLNDRMKKGDSLPLKCNPTSSDDQKAPPPAPAPIKSLGVAGKPQLRSAELCRSGNAYEREKFRPRPIRDQEKEKRRLQNLLATGQDAPENKPRKSSAPPEPEPERDRFQEVLDEISERQQFLEDMAALGRGRQYEALISTEISQKIRELEIIDKERSSELRKMMERKQEEEAEKK
ncbi:hypothetical protein AOXY_G27216 [Acipenser oxyrinchus oxyrinchus]|uniref:Uncharacterized protein n=1 Tax=Acipenser oxyrinchus oxyrinchus TaxID=40147 RepID=A0AAD8CPT3_ACIOX|nr:hypothetical protein AOXY_G27216 [Acipenser oxyrinchus oxyrinchus]